MLRSKIGDVKDLDGFKTYMKFKHEVMNLAKSDRPEESSWPMVLLEVFMPRSIDWLAKIRVDKIYEIQVFIMKIESTVKANKSNDSECIESIESDNEYEESQFYELDDNN